MKTLFTIPILFLGLIVLGQGYPFIQFNEIFGPGDDEVKELSIAEDGTKIFIGTGKQIGVSGHSDMVYTHHNYDFIGELNDDGTNWRLRLPQGSIHTFSSLNNHKLIFEYENKSVGLGDLPGPHYYNRSLVQMSNDSTIDWKFPFYGEVPYNTLERQFLDQLPNGNILYAGYFRKFSYWGTNAVHKSRPHLAVLEIDQTGALIDQAAIPIEGRIEEFMGISQDDGYYSFALVTKENAVAVNGAVLQGDMKNNIVVIRYHLASKSSFSLHAASMDERPYLNHLHYSTDGHLFLGFSTHAERVKYGGDVRYHQPNYTTASNWLLSLNSLGEPVGCTPLVLSQGSRLAGLTDHSAGVGVFLSSLTPVFRLVGDHPFQLSPEDHRHFGMLSLTNTLDFASFEPINSLPATATMIWEIREKDNRIYVLGCENHWNEFIAFGLTIPQLVYGEGSLFEHVSMESFIVQFENPQSVGVDDEPFSADFKLFPNPARDNVNLAFTTEVPTRVSVVDSRGITVNQVDVHDGRTTLELRGFAPGHYLLRIEFKDGSFAIKKLVVQ